MENIQRIEVGNSRYLAIDESEVVLLPPITVDTTAVTADRTTLTIDNQ